MYRSKNVSPAQERIAIMDVIMLQKMKQQQQVFHNRSYLPVDQPVCLPVCPIVIIIIIIIIITFIITI